MCFLHGAAGLDRDCSRQADGAGEIAAPLRLVHAADERRVQRLDEVRVPGVAVAAGQRVRVVGEEVEPVVQLDQRTLAFVALQKCKFFTREEFAKNT